MVTFNTIVSLGWPIGELILAMEAYLIRDHITLQLVSHAPMLLVILVIFFGIPESTRWLISKKMHDQAKNQVLNIAKTNKSSIPEILLNIQVDRNKKECSTSASEDCKDAGNCFNDLDIHISLMLLIFLLAL